MPTCGGRAVRCTSGNANCVWPVSYTPCAYCVISPAALFLASQEEICGLKEIFSTIWVPERYSSGFEKVISFGILTFASAVPLLCNFLEQSYLSVHTALLLIVYFCCRCNLSIVSARSWIQFRLSYCFFLWVRSRGRHVVNFLNAGTMSLLFLRL